MKLESRISKLTAMRKGVVIRDDRKAAWLAKVY